MIKSVERFYMCKGRVGRKDGRPSSVKQKKKRFHLDGIITKTSTRWSRRGKHSGMLGEATGIMQSWKGERDGEYWNIGMMEVWEDGRMERCHANLSRH